VLTGQDPLDRLALVYRDRCAAAGGTRDIPRIGPPSRYSRCNPRPLLLAVPDPGRSWWRGCRRKPVSGVNRFKVALTAVGVLDAHSMR